MDPKEKELLISLIGSTYGELKRLDDSIIGTSSTLSRRSEQAKSELANILKGNAVKPDVPILQAVQPALAQLPVQIPVFNHPQQMGVMQMAPPLPQEPDNQLSFDFDKKARYDDVIVEIERLERKLDKVIELLERLDKNPSEPKKNRGTLV